MEGRHMGIDDIPCSSIAVDGALRIGTAGLIWGACTGSYDSKNLGLKGISNVSFLAKSAGKYGLQWGLFAAVYCLTSCGVRRYRGQEDWVNRMVGGVVAGAGAAAAARSPNWKLVAGVSGLACAMLPNPGQLR